MKPSTLARITSQLSKTSAIVDAIDAKHARRAGAQAEFVAPAGELEVALANIWRSLLRVDQVGRNDDFFLLGGQSLMAVQMISRVKDQFGVALPLMSIFSNPTLSEFSAAIQAGEVNGNGHVASALPVVARPSRLPLSFGQQRLWFLDQLEPGSSFYNVALSWRLRGALNREALEAALSEIVSRHEVLRTRYVLDVGEPVQSISAPAPLVLATLDLSSVAEAEREPQARAIVSEEANRPFDLERGPVFRASLVKLADEDHVLVLTTHHIATDGWSFGVLRQEISALYAAFASGRPSPLPALEQQYADWALWQRSHVAGAELERQLDYWKQHLLGAPPSIDLPTDKPRPAVQTYRGRSHAAQLPSDLIDGLKELSRRHGATLYMTLLAAFGTLLSRYSGQQDIVIGSAIAGRTGRDTEKLIGLFVNSLALRIDLSGAPSFDELLERVRATTVGAYSHQDIPFEKLVEELNPVRDSSRSPLYQVMLILQNLPAEKTAMPGLELSVFGAARETSQMDLLLNLVEHKDGIRATLTYNTDLFEEATVRRMLEHYRRLLESVAQNSALAIAQAPLLSEAEIDQLTQGWNQTAANYPDAQSVHGLISAQAEARPQATAVAFGRERLSYSELEERSNRLAHHLAARGIGRGHRVAVYLDRSLDLIVSLLAVMKSGAAYVPLDTHYPARRVESILNDAAVKCLLTKSALKPSNYAGDLLLIDGEARAIARQPASAFASPAAPDDPVYIIFTSGSTGRPKGVEIPHRAVVNLLTAMARELAMSPDDVFPALASVSFDMSVPELYLPLATGGKLALAEAHLAGNGEELARFLGQHGATIVHATPTTWALLLDAGFTAAGLKRCIGAEPLPQRIFERLMAAAPGSPLWNFYGPTETTVWSTVHQFTSADERIVVGRPLANQQVYILDPAGQPCPIGVPGEIHIAGAGMALGYFNRPDLTAESFVANRFDPDPSARMYRTSDLGRWTDVGTIEHLGRTDQQVKVRGFRIELGEIEAALSAQPGVREAVAIVREDSPGDKRLVAYIVADIPPESTATLDATNLRAALKQTLPDYMVPSAFVQLERMPLTPNGKLDRLHLPLPETEHRQGREPRTYMEVLVAEIWKEVLNIKSVNAEDDFFELGGHSLLAAQMVVRVSEATGIKVPLISIFSNPTLSEFSAAIQAGEVNGNGHVASALPVVARPSRLPLSFGQQRLWFLDQLEPGSSFYNVALSWRLRGALNREALEAALSEIVSRHEVLRTRYVLDVGEPVQSISAPAPLVLATLDLSSVAEAEREPQARAIVSEEANRPFDLERGPVFRASLVKLADEDHVLVLTTHHIATDGWSFGVLRQEISALYAAFASGRPSPLPALEQQYADWALWQRSHVAGAELERQLDYWKQHLLGAPPSIDLPTDKPRPAVQTYRGRSHAAQLPSDLIDGLKELSRRHGATLYMTLLAAFGTLLSRYSGQQDIVIGSAIAGRTGRDTEKLIGLFVNSLALRIDLSGAPSFDELLERVRATTVGAYSHQDIPFEKLVEELNPVRDSSRSPLYQVMLILQNLPAEKTAMPGLELSVFGAARETSQMDLLLNLVEHKDGIRATLTYNTDLFEEATVRRMLEHYRRLLESVAQNSALAIAQAPLLSEAEIDQLTQGWNQTAANYPDAQSVHGLISAQAEARPQATAVAFGRERLSYSELEERSNRLAHHLAARGIGRGHRVAVYLDRSLDLIVSLLAVMKSGAAYVPLDTHYPARRVESILNDAAVKCLLTKSALKPSNYAGDLLLIDGEARAIARQPASAFASPAAPDDPVYIIFTSGSTGRPKGVEIPHRAVVNLLTAMARELAMSPDDVFPALASVSFDMSVPELYLPLATGGKLALAEAHLAGNGEELARFLGQHGATIVHATPTTWALLLDAGFTAAGLKRCIGAEPLPQRIFERLMAAAPGSPLWNFYGPTETTVWSTVHQFTSADERIVVGRPLANQQVYILDPAGQPCPIGVPGEIHIAGAGMALGYFNRPDLTAESFVANRFDPDPSARMYRTSDLGRWTDVGTIEHLGRTDQQVKVRGFRIELGEIEAALSAQPGVREAVAIVREDSPGDKRLVAYIVADIPPESTATLDATNLRAALKQTLPDYMVPSAFVQLERMPLTPNGKLDRLHLPLPETEHRQGREPRTYMEVLVAEIWKEVLNIKSVNAEDDFFELGGHSLLAAEMINKLNDSLGFRVRLATMFEATTLGALAAAAENQGVLHEQVTPIVPIHRRGNKPALFCVSRPNVNSLGFIFLSRSLSGDLPVYGLQSNTEKDGIFTPFTQLEYDEKAAEYIAAIRSIQPEGPYFIAGFCEGAHIAFEMARQLEAMNLEVGNLFIFDVWPLENTIVRSRFVLYDYLKAVRRRWIKATRRRPHNRISAVRNDVLPAVRKQIIDTQLLADPAARSHFTRLMEERYWPGKDYRPTIYGGDAIVFRVAKQFFYRIKDASLGWGQRVRGSVEVIHVPGIHAHILREPGVSIIARKIEETIDEYLAQKSSNLLSDTQRK